MLFLCVFQNLNSFWEGVLYYTEVTPWHASHTRAQSIMYSITVFLFYFLSNLIYWLFGYKYWVISIEVPRSIAATKKWSEEKDKSICSETGYEILNWVGIIINLIFCLLLGWKRGVLEEAEFGRQPDQNIAVMVSTLDVIITVLLIISAIILADALRRIKKSFSQDNRLAVN